MDKLIKILELRGDESIKISDLKVLCSEIQKERESNDYFARIILNAISDKENMHGDDKFPPSKMLEVLDGIKYREPEHNFDEDPMNNSFWFIFHQMRKYLKDNIQSERKCHSVFMDFKLYLIRIRDNGNKFLFSPLYTLDKILSIGKMKRIDMTEIKCGNTQNNKYVLKLHEGSNKYDCHYQIMKKTPCYIFIMELEPIHKCEMNGYEKSKLYKINNFIGDIKKKEFYPDFNVYEVEDYFTDVYYS